jgi:SAM-dependent methyltransferase
VTWRAGCAGSVLTYATRDGRGRWARAPSTRCSAIATHWLRPHELAAVYYDVVGLLRPGGVLLNADGLYYPRAQNRVRAVVEAVDQRRQERAVDERTEAWGDWWDALRAEPALHEAFAMRDRIFPPEQGDIFPFERRVPGSPPTLAFHEAALLEAGFEEVGTVWQDLHKRILLAFR